MILLAQTQAGAPVRAVLDVPWPVWVSLCTVLISAAGGIFKAMLLRPIPSAGGNGARDKTIELHLETIVSNTSETNKRLEALTLDLHDMVRGFRDHDRRVENLPLLLAQMSEKVDTLYERGFRRRADMTTSGGA